MWAEVRERFGVDLREVDSEGGPTIPEAWALVRRLLDEQGTATWAAAEGDPELVGYTAAVMVAENDTITALAIAHAQGGSNNWKPPMNRLEESRHKRRARRAAHEGVDALASFLGLSDSDFENWDDN